MRRYGLRKKRAAGRLEKSAWRFVSKWLRISVLMLCAAFFFGCGGSSGSAGGGGNQQLDVDAVDSGNLNPSENYPSKYTTGWHELFNSSRYNGRLAVKFKKETEMRLRNGVMFSHTQPNQASVANELLLNHGGITRRLLKVSEETIERALERAAREGKKLHDWNLYYTVEIQNPGHAEELYKELRDSDAVEWIHPILASKAFSGGATPDLSGEQTYIKPHGETGGLNIQAAWDMGISGQGVTIVNVDTNWNFDHEDLAITEGDFLYLATYDPDKGNEGDIQHGTAMVGLLNAIKDNNIGIIGIAHSSEVKLIQAESGSEEKGAISYISGLLEDYANGTNGFVGVKMGDVVAVTAGSGGTELDCPIYDGTKSPYWCLPDEAQYLVFDAMREAAEAWGIIVVEASGNSGADLSSSNLVLPDCGGSNPCPDLSLTEDIQLPEGEEPQRNQIISGAIVVAASGGGKDDTRPEWSNCGDRVDVYAWGQGALTAGYGDHPASDQLDKNKWYTEGVPYGTSFAAAMVAGSAALIQNYTSELYKDIVPHKKVYFDAWGMRELLRGTGVNAASGEECSIGVKPDVGAAMAAVQNGDYLPKVAPDTETLVARKLAVAGIRYDMDRDGRAELISWDPLASENGAWKIDLSSVAPDVPDPHPDNYGAWDLVINIPSSSASTLAFPVVHDYDSDGDADLALYDSENGLWYIKYTPSPIPSPLEGEGEGGGGEGNPPSPPEGEGWGEGELEWDTIIDYSTDPAWKSHSRPVPGDYNGDNFLDLALATPDGHWLIDYGGIGHIEKQGSNIVYVDDFGGFEEDVKFLTDEQLAKAPGWAYLPGVFPRTSKTWFFYKVPDGLEDEGKLVAGYYPDFDYNPFGGLPAIYGENDDIVSAMTYGIKGSGSFSTAIMVKNDDGTWDVAPESGLWGTLQQYPPYEGYGGVICHPIVADYNGSGADDRAVKCGSTWRIVYSGAENPEFRIIEMDDSIVSLPPYVYPGGIKYQDIISIYNHYKYQLGCGKGEECTIFDATPPIGPHFAQCIKYWAPPPNYCWNK